MNSADYTFLLSQPNAVTDRQTEALEKIVNEFPYFQSARALRLKGLYNQNSFQYNLALKVTAAYTTDRSVLFDFITSDSFTTIQKGLFDRKIARLNSMEVSASEVIANNARESSPAVDTVQASILSSIKESGSDSEKAEHSSADIAEFETADPTEDTLQQTPETVVEELIGQREIVEPDDASATEVHETATQDIEPNTEPFNGLDSIKATEISEIEPFTEIEFVPIDQAEMLSDENPKTDETTIVETPLHETQTPEVKLHIGEPLAFSKTETHSFQEWLQLSKLQPIQREEVGNEKSETEESSGGHGKSELEGTDDEKISEVNVGAVDLKAKKNALIDKFIESNPKIPQIKPQVEQKDFLPESKDVHSSLMTETLARVYLEQKKYQKAIQAYEILILKYPEKSSFFADRISEIKILQQNT